MRKLNSLPKKLSFLLQKRPQNMFYWLSIEEKCYWIRQVQKTDRLLARAMGRPVFAKRDHLHFAFGGWELIGCHFNQVMERELSLWTGSCAQPISSWLDCVLLWLRTMLLCCLHIRCMWLCSGGPRMNKQPLCLSVCLSVCLPVCPSFNGLAIYASQYSTEIFSFDPPPQPPPTCVPFSILSFSVCLSVSFSLFFSVPSCLFLRIDRVFTRIQVDSVGDSGVCFCHCVTSLERC